jgi:hypothetical protein
MNRAFKILLLFFVLLSCKTVLAQAPVSEGEQQIKYYLDQIQYWRYQYSPDDSGVNPDASPTDSVAAMNKALLNYLIANTALLRTDFKSLDEAGMKIVTSDDKKLRIYSWDTETGDEKHVYDAVAQYETNNGLNAEALNDISAREFKPGSLYTDIYTIDHSRKNYLVIASAIRSQKDAMKGIYGYTIENNKLAAANSLPGGAIEYTYDYFSNYDYKSMKEKNMPHMDKGRLYIPVVESDKITGKWMVYEFDGNQFKAK